MANGVQEYFEGFVYRGRPPGSDQPAAWHVEIGRYVEIEGVGRTMLPTLTLTPEQAVAAGRALPDVLADLSVEAAAERDAALSSVRDLTKDRDAVAVERDARTAERDAVAADRDAVAAERDALAAQLAEATAPKPAAIISDRQFFQALALSGDITEAEALAAVMTGTLPARIEKAVEALPEADRFAARMLLSGATTYDLAHPMVAVLGAVLEKNGAALAALWDTAAKL